MAGVGLAEGEFSITPGDVRAIAAMVYADSGIVLHEGKTALVYSRLAKRLRALRLRDFAEYCAMVASALGGEERGRMVAALTTNVTRFYRELHHFEHLRCAVLPGLIARAQQGGRVRLWSAACSNGAEPYTMGLTLLSCLQSVARRDIRILATDIDPNMIEAGVLGQYDAAALEPVPTVLRRRYFAPAAAPGVFEADAELRGLINFQRLNLIGDWPFAGAFDVIFCRNVTIYFDMATQAALLARFARLLAPGGVLYLGHSERLVGPASALLTPDGITTYRRAAVGGA